jgi:hypothetical protein
MSLPLISENQRYLITRGGTATDRLPVLAADFNPLVEVVNDLIDGTTSLTEVEVGNGTVAAPSVTFTSDPDTGLYRIGTNNMGVAANGAKVLDVATTGLGVTGQLAVTKNVVLNHTPYKAATDTTAGWTLTEVKTGLVAGTIKTTSAAAVTLILDSVANIITAFATAGVTLTTGSNIQFFVDNTTGANTVTVQVDGGATIAVATPVITGGATLTVSTANKVGLFNLYLQSATVGILSRVI